MRLRQLDFHQWVRCFHLQLCNGTAVTLTLIPDHVENHEAKEFFQSNYSVVYFIFHDAFSIVEGNIRTKGGEFHASPSTSGPCHIFLHRTMLARIQSLETSACSLQCTKAKEKNSRMFVTFSKKYWSSFPSSSRKVGKRTVSGL